MYNLTKEQKVSNLKENLLSLKKKRNNLDLQIRGIEQKLQKLQIIDKQDIPSISQEKTNFFG